MTRQDTYVVITIGTSASTHLWPYSRKQKPKQFLDFFGTGKSLLQTVFEQYKGVCPEEHIYIVVSKEHAHWVYEQLPHLDRHQVLAEPVRRNSAPCVAYACYKIRKKDPNAVVVISPADHLIMGEVAFVRDIRKSVEVAFAHANKLLVMGIRPHKPEVRYHYIQYHLDSGSFVKKVKTLTENPQQDLAQLFLDSGDFAWNTDIYVWHINAIIAAFENHLSDVAEIFEDGYNVYDTEEEERFIQHAYSQCKSVSLTHGIFERVDNMHMILGNFDWASVSSWNNLHELKPKDDNHNSVDANAMIYDSKNCFVRGAKDKLIVIADLNSYLVSDTDDVLLICPRHMEDRFKEFIKDAKANGDHYI